MEDEGERAEAIFPGAGAYFEVIAACPEKLVFCIDTSAEMGTQFGSSGVSSLDMVKRGLVMLIRNKAMMNAHHQFAICTLSDSVTQVFEMSSDAEAAIAALESITVGADVREFDLGLLLGHVLQRYGHLVSGNKLGGDPAMVSHLMRVVLVYGRSYQVPTLSWSEEQVNGLLELPTMFWDTLYVHQRSSNEGVRVQEIYDFLTKIESDSEFKRAYFFEASTNAGRLFQHVAMLMAHPVQRREQAEALKLLDVNLAAP
jgi:hypothetical protein